MDENDCETGHTIRDVGQDKKQVNHPPRFMTTRIKDREAQRILSTLVSQIVACLRTEATTAHERHVGRRRIEEEADQRIAEYMLGFRSGVDPDTSAFQWLSSIHGSGAIQDGVIPGIVLLNPESMEEFDAFRNFLVPVISRNFKKEEYLMFLEALVTELAGDLTSMEVKRLGSKLARLGNDMDNREQQNGSTRSRGQV